MSLHVLFPEGGSKDVPIPEGAVSPHVLLRNGVVSESGKTANSFFHGGDLIGRTTQFPKDGNNIAVVDKTLYPSKSFPQTDMSMCCDRSRFVEFSKETNYPEVTPPSAEKQKQLDHTHRVINNMEDDVKAPYWMQALQNLFPQTSNYQMKKEKTKPMKRIEQITACEEEDGVEDEIPCVQKEEDRTDKVMTEMVQNLQRRIEAVPDRTNYEMGIMTSLMGFFDEGSEVYRKKFTKILKGEEVPLVPPKKALR